MGRGKGSAPLPSRPLPTGDRFNREAELSDPCVKPGRDSAPGDQDVRSPVDEQLRRANTGNGRTC